MNSKSILGAALAAALAVGAGALAWRAGLLPVDMTSKPRHEAATAPQAAPGAPAAPAAPTASAVAAAPAEEVHETPDSESGLDALIPRQSVGHAAGLDKTPDPLKLGSSAALVLEPGAAKPVFAKNENAVLPIASVTKLMTAMVLMDQQLPMDQTLTITEDDMDRARHSRSRLRVGSVLTRADALQLALMSSENRAAHALARTAPGGVNAFVAAMNRKARALGMNSTSYVEPTGLSEKNQSTATDLATLVIAASAYPLLREYSTTPERRIAFGSRVLQYRNSDPLVRNGWDVQLQKTGYIVEAGHCVVMRTRIAERDLVMVLLDAGSNRVRSADAQRIRSWLGGGPDPAVAAARAKKREQRALAADKADKAEKSAAKGGKSSKADKNDKAEKHAKAGKPAARQGDGRVAKTFDGKHDKPAARQAKRKEAERSTAS
ncbi:MAG: D-alanyl-D-alanine endopeptidase [Pseudomonadota bacterium]